MTEQPNITPDLNEVREFFSRDTFATAVAGITILSARDGYAECSFAITPNHLNGLGTAQGGAVFTLADFTFAVASNCVEVGTVTVASSVNFVKSPRGGVLTAVAERVTQGRTTSVYTVTVRSDDGAVCAIATFTGYKRTERG